MLECMPIYDVFLFCSKLFAPFRGKVVQNSLFGATTHKYIDFTALNAGIRWERKIHLWYHLYHRDHDDRLIPASYVVPQINQYLILRKIYFFAPKSLLVGTPTVMVIDYCRGYMNAWMDGPCSTFSCSNLMQAKESEQFQYFAIKWNSGLQFTVKLIQFLQSAKENDGELLCV